MNISLLCHRNRETSSLLKQIELMERAVAREEEKAEKLEIQSKSVESSVTIITMQYNVQFSHAQGHSHSSSVVLGEL